MIQTQHTFKTDFGEANIVFGDENTVFVLEDTNTDIEMGLLPFNFKSCKSKVIPTIYIKSDKGLGPVYIVLAD